MKSAVLASLAILLTACASSRYEGWEHVRIEYSVPNSACEYKIQEACSATGAGCFNFYKKRATVYGANTVVITGESKDVVGKSKGLVINGSGGANASVRTDMTALADYYACPKK